MFRYFLVLSLVLLCGGAAQASTEKLVCTDLRGVDFPVEVTHEDGSMIIEVDGREAKNVSLKFHGEQGIEIYFHGALSALPCRYAD